MRPSGKLKNSNILWLGDMNTRSRIRRVAAWSSAVVVILSAAAFFARGPLLAALGRQLVQADRLQKADAIVVLGGGTPQREIEAADLYLAGWAPRVLITLEREPEALDILRKRGIAFETRIEFRRRILRSLGVPDSSVTLLDQTSAASTTMESELVKNWVVTNPARRLIIVTSAYHTARASMIFRRSLRERGIDILAHPASHEAFEPQRWWRDREQLRNGVFEWQKLMFYYVAYQ